MPSFLVHRGNGLAINRKAKEWKLQYLTDHFFLIVKSQTKVVHIKVGNFAKFLLHASKLCIIYFILFLFLFYLCVNICVYV